MMREIESFTGDSAPLMVTIIHTNKIRISIFGICKVVINEIPPRHTTTLARHLPDTLSYLWGATDG